MASPTHHLVFTSICILVLRELNGIVTKPYMDEPFHVPQAQAYCDGRFDYWDPKITTPPGLYVFSLLLKRIFMFKCNLQMLRLTPMFSLVALPIALTYLLSYHQRVRPPASLLTPTLESVVVAGFPIAWFFGFLYYTEVPSLLSVVCTVVAASQGRHWRAGMFGLISCTFRQTNVVWVLYAYASSQLMYLRFRRRTTNEGETAKLHDPSALKAGPDDLVKAVMSAPKVLPDILQNFVPYGVVVALFAVFVVLNGGIVLGDKSNHIPAFHIPQVYYFVGFTTIIGWPVLISTPGGVWPLIKEVRYRMVGTLWRSLATAVVSASMAFTIYKFTIHHPFLLSDNRHYTFYVWRRVFLLHPVVPYLLIPGYIACAWAWYLRVGRDQTLLQNLLLPVFVLPTLLPTPLLEPRYFLIPYILLRAQVPDAPRWGVLLEGAWYAAINAATMWVFLYREREGVGRFMW
ncbi:glucosyltransferase [Heliocybe sulcata]|uniref:Dol-P-Glc:Glc(2)Man(9)GlcNAc(2)-PP-Dol alpha-1,2-glucosyltransferase n=1 Tax=Heliocybe sulcata TaxID=5364 RepID=A0A5C3NL42_9AGAM|nr:glucosyltransferase [Heliocybe sulcata]